MKSRSNQTTQLALIAVAGLALMIALPAALVLSPWYSYYFFKTVKTDALEIYKGSVLRADKTATSTAVNKLASSISPNSRNISFIDLHIMEELALRDVLTGAGNSTYLDALRSRLTNTHDEQVRSIILTKLVRSQLAGARAALSRKELTTASELLRSAFEDLKSLSPAPEYNPPRRYVDGILSLSGAIKTAQGKPKEAESVSRLQTLLKDPTLAKGWYQQNKLTNYERSYPADYSVYYLLGTPAGVGLEPRAIKNALGACENEQVNNSTKLVAIRKAIAAIDKNADLELIDRTMRIWCNNFSSQKLHTADLAIQGWKLYSALLHLPPNPYSDVLTKQIISAIALETLPDVLAQQFFNNYETTQYVWKNWPLLSKDAAQSSVKELRQIQSLCQSRGLDETAIRLGLITALAAADDPANAQIELRHGLDACSKNQPELQERLTGFCWVAGSKPGAPDTTTDDGLEIYRYALKKDYWLPEWRMRLLISLSERLDKANNTIEANKIREQASRLAKTATPSANHQAAFDSDVLSLLLEHHKFEDGYRYYRQLQTRYAHQEKPLADMSMMFLHHWRSFPNTGKPLAQQAEQAHFPDIAFKNALTLNLKEYGENSEQYHNTLFWLAQYELCRRNDKAAIALSRQSFEGQTNEKASTCLAAKDFSAEISGGKATMPSGSIPARFGTKDELFCLWSLYTQFGRTQAAARALKLQAAVVEGKR